MKRVELISEEQTTYEDMGRLSEYNKQDLFNNSSEFKTTEIKYIVGKIEKTFYIFRWFKRYDLNKILEGVVVDNDDNVFCTFKKDTIYGISFEILNSTNFRGMEDLKLWLNKYLIKIRPKLTGP